MSRWTPCKRNDFVRRVRKFGFQGPFSGTRHQFMVYGQQRLTVPSNAEYTVPQLRMLIGEIEGILGSKTRAAEFEKAQTLRYPLPHPPCATRYGNLERPDVSANCVAGKPGRGQAQTTASELPDGPAAARRHRKGHSAGVLYSFSRVCSMR